MSNNFHWVGTDTSFNTSANWSSATSGAGGYGVPTSADNIIFDYGSQDCNLSSAIICHSISSTPTYSGDLNLSGNNITCVSGGGISLDHNGTINTGGSVDLTTDSDVYVSTLLTGLLFGSARFIFTSDGTFDVRGNRYLDGIKLDGDNLTVTYASTNGVHENGFGNYPLEAGNNCTFIPNQRFIMRRSSEPVETTLAFFSAGSNFTVGGTGIFEFYALFAINETRQIPAFTYTGSNQVRYICTSENTTLEITGDLDLGTATINLGADSRMYDHTLDLNGHTINCGTFAGPMIRYLNGPTPSCDFTSATINCNNFVLGTQYAVTSAHAGNWNLEGFTLNTSGDITYPAYQNISGDYNINIFDDCDITSNSATLGNINVNTSGTVNLQDALTCSTVTITDGNWYYNSNTLDCVSGGFSMDGGVRTLSADGETFIAGDFHVGGSVDVNIDKRITFTDNGNLDIDRSAYDINGITINAGVTVTRICGATGQSHINDGDGVPLIMGDNSTFTVNGSGDLGLWLGSAGASMTFGSGAVINGSRNIVACLTNAAVTGTCPAFTYSGTGGVYFQTLSNSSSIQLTGALNVTSGTGINFNLIGSSTSIDLNEQTITAPAFSYTGTGTFDFDNTTQNTDGNYSIAATSTISNPSTSTINITGTCDLTSNGKTLGAIVFPSGSSGTTTLQDDLTCASIAMNSGNTNSFVANGNDITCISGGMNLVDGRITITNPSNVSLAGDLTYKATMLNQGSRINVFTFTANATITWNDTGSNWDIDGGLVIADGVTLIKAGSVGTAFQPHGNGSNAAITMTNATLTLNSGIQVKMDATGSVFNLTGSNTFNGSDTMELRINGGNNKIATIDAFTLGGTVNLYLNTTAGTGHSFLFDGDVAVSGGTFTHNILDGNKIDFNGNILTVGDYTEQLNGTERIELNGGSFVCDSFDLTGTGGTFDVSAGNIVCTSAFTAGSNLTFGNANTGNLLNPTGVTFNTNGVEIPVLYFSGTSADFTLNESIKCAGVTTIADYSGDFSYGGYELSSNGDMNFDHTGALAANATTHVNGNLHAGNTIAGYDIFSRIHFTGSGNLDIDDVVIGTGITNGLELDDDVTVPVIGASQTSITDGTPIIILGDNATLTVNNTVKLRNTVNANSAFSLGAGAQINGSGTVIIEMASTSIKTCKVGNLNYTGTGSVQCGASIVVGIVELDNDTNIDGELRVLDNAQFNMNSQTLDCGSFRFGNGILDMTSGTINCDGDFYMDDPTATIQNISDSIINILGTCTFTSNGITFQDINANTAAQILTFVDGLTCDNLKANPAARLRFKGGETYTWSTFNELDWAGETINKITIDTDGGVAFWDNPSSMKLFNCNVSGISALEEVDAFVTDGNTDNGSNTNFDFTETYPAIFNVTWNNSTSTIGVECSGAEPVQLDGKVEVSETGEANWVELDVYLGWSDNLVSGTIGNLSADSYDVKLTNDDGQSTISIGGLSLGGETVVQATYNGESVSIVGYSKSGDSTYPIYVDGSYNLIISKDYTISAGTIVATGASIA